MYSEKKIKVLAAQIDILIADMVISSNVYIISTFSFKVAFTLHIVFLECREILLGPHVSMETKTVEEILHEFFTFHFFTGLLRIWKFTFQCSLRSFQYHAQLLFIQVMLVCQWLSIFQSSITHSQRPYLISIGCNGCLLTFKIRATDSRWILQVCLACSNFSQYKKKRIIILCYKQHYLKICL